MRTAFDAVIVGAGPAGSAAAILLARAGWSVALIEQQVFPRRKVCGECIAASNGPLLDALGAGAVFAAGGVPLRHVMLMRGGAAVKAALPAAPHARHPWGRAVGREVLDAVLRDRACVEGATMLQPWRVDACERSRDIWSCRISTEQGARVAILEATVLIDAHGSWSRLAGVSPDAGALDERAASDLFAFKANYTGSTLSPGVLPVLSFRGGYGGMVLESAGVATVACCVRRDRLADWRRTWPGLAAGNCVERALSTECGGVRAALEGATRVGPWLAVGPLRPGVRVALGDGVFRIGNAAGEAHPILGEGISMALQSAALLVAHLRSTSRVAASSTLARRAAARAYADAYTRAFDRRYRLAGVFARAAMGQASGAAMVALAKLCPAMLTAGARLGGKVQSAVDVASIAAVDPSVAGVA